MPIETPQYDVAISFLSKDESIATAIYQKLDEGLSVFFYPRSQEELAGTDGLESMRKPFFDDSRVMVVLYREPWGRTPWTRVEETAIKEGCLEHGWERLFFIALDRKSAFPVWLPKTLVRFNYEDFGLEQAVGAIKARVQENGGEYSPLTALKKAEIYKADELYRRDKARMDTPEGLKAIFQSVAELLGNIERHCVEITAKGSMRIRCEKVLQEGQQTQSCTLTNGLVSMVVAWNQLYSTTLDHSSLVVREFNGGLILPKERGQRMYSVTPQKIQETQYSPDLSRAREYGWNEDGASEFLSSTALAERCVIQFVDLANRYNNGEIKRLTDF